MHLEVSLGLMTVKVKKPTPAQINVHMKDVKGVVEVRNCTLRGLIPIFQLFLEFSSVAVVKINEAETDNRVSDCNEVPAMKTYGSKVCLSSAF